MRGVTIAVAVLLLFGLTASAAFHKAHLDPLITNLKGQLDGGELERKQNNAAKQSVKIYDKGSDSLDKDVKGLKKIAGKVEKAFTEDPTVMSLLRQAVDAYWQDVNDRHEGLSQGVDEQPDSKKKTGAQKKLDKSGNFLDDAMPIETKIDPSTLKGRAILILKANKSLKKPQKFVDNPPTGGGGKCPGSALGSGELCKGTANGTAFQTQNKQVAVAGSGETLETIILVYDCTKGREHTLEFGIRGVPMGKGYNIGIFGTDVFFAWATHVDPQAFLKTLLSGTFDVTAVDAQTGMITADFNAVELEGSDVVTGQLKIKLPPAAFGN